jgi:hypothetical protein
MSNKAGIILYNVCIKNLNTENNKNIAHKILPYFFLLSLQSQDSPVSRIVTVGPLDDVGAFPSIDRNFSL